MVRLVRMTISSTRARVKVNRNISKTFMLKTDVKQGDGLSSSTIFNLALHKVSLVVNPK